MNDQHQIHCRGARMRGTSVNTNDRDNCCHYYKKKIKFSWGSTCQHVIKYSTYFVKYLKIVTS